MAQGEVVGFEGIGNDVSWRRAHEELVRLAKQRAGLDVEEGRWLLRAFRAGAHVELGLGSFNEYVERLFGYGPRLTQEKLRVAPHAHVDVPNVHDEPTRAKQSIPPARRRMVLRRDGGRCRVPGCRNATFVDVHHSRPRSEGGSNDIENLVTLCAAHHRAIHDGRLFCEGTPATGLAFRHANGIRYGSAPLTMRTDSRAKVAGALTHMGFPESEAREALGRIPPTAELTVDSLLRAALRELVPAAS